MRSQFDIGQAITRPWHLPGRRGFIIRTVLCGMALYLVVVALFGKPFISQYAEFFQLMYEFDQVDEPDPEDIEAALSTMGGFFRGAMLVGLLSWLVSVSMETAMHKNAFRGTDHGAFPLRFGADEFRVLLVQLCVFVTIGAVYFGGMIAIFATGSAGLIAFAILGFIVLIAWLSARLAPAASMSVRDRQFRFVEAMGLSSGFTWWMIAAYVIIGIGGYVVMGTIMTIVFSLAFSGPEAEQLMTNIIGDDPAQMFEALGAQLKNPVTSIILVIGTMLYVFGSLLWNMHLWAVGNYVTSLDRRQDR